LPTLDFIVVPLNPVYVILGIPDDDNSRLAEGLTLTRRPGDAFGELLFWYTAYRYGTAQMDTKERKADGFQVHRPSNSFNFIITVSPN